MAYLNIILNQEKILQLLPKDRNHAFRELLQNCLNGILMAEFGVHLKATPIASIAEMVVNDVATRKVSRVMEPFVEPVSPSRRFYWMRMKGFWMPLTMLLLMFLGSAASSISLRTFRRKPPRSTKLVSVRICRVCGAVKPLKMLVKSGMKSLLTTKT